MTTITDGEAGLSVRTKLNASLAKTDLITVAQAVDLDAIETRVNALDAAIILRGTWNASGGTFPGGGTAQAGDSWIVSTGGTVNGVIFAVNDRIIAILDNASTTTFAANWFKADYTDVFQTNAEIETAYNAQVSVVTQAEAQAGTATTRRGWTAQRVAQAIAALAPAGGASPSYYNDTGATLTKGTPVCLAAFHTGSGLPGMAAADADGSGLMPVIGILGANCLNGASAAPVLSGGKITGLDTSAYTLNQVLYAGSTPGALTGTRPTTGFIQPVAFVSRVGGAGVGEIIVRLWEAGNVLIESFAVAVSDETTDLVVGKKIDFPFTNTGVITKVFGWVNGAPTGSQVQFDLKVGGTSIFSTLPTIDATETTTETAAVPQVISNGAMTKYGAGSITVTQTGSTAPGKGFKAIIEFYRTT